MLAYNGSIAHPEFKDGDESTILCLQILHDPTQTRSAFNIVVDYRDTTADEYLDHWARLDTAFSKIGSQIHHAKCVFGFADHEEMVSFATNILENTMPTIFGLATMLYSIHVADDDDENDAGRWFRASLDSEEITGTDMGKTDLAGVYL